MPAILSRSSLRLRKDLTHAFGMPETWVEIPVAQFRYDPEDNLWTLYCADRNSRWHPDMEIDSLKDFDRLLQEIDRDPTGIYWG